MSVKPKFDYNDIVRAVPGVSAELRPGKRAWIVAIHDETLSGNQRKGSYFDKFPPGVVYTIEFEDGSSTEAHEDDLAFDPSN